MRLYVRPSVTIKGMVGNDTPSVANEIHFFQLQHFLFVFISFVGRARPIHKDVVRNNEHVVVMLVYTSNKKIS